MILRMSMTIAISLAIATGAIAQGRPDSRTMSCAQVQDMIVQNGAVVLTTGQFTYDRYVATRQFCSHPYVPVLASVPTQDRAQCPVYRCGEDLFQFDE